MTYKFKEGQKVIVHSLGEFTPGEWIAYIRGVSGEYGPPHSHMYIVQWVRIPTYIGPDYEGYEDLYPFSCSTIPESCIKEA